MTKAAKRDKPVKRFTLQQGNSPEQQEINTLVALFAEGRYLEAAILAQQMTERFPNHGFGWMALGTAFKQLGRSTEVLAPLQKAAALLPSDAAAHYNLGIALQDIGRHDEAEVSYRRALSIKLNYTEAYINLGLTLQTMGRLDEAEVSYRQALELNPDYFEAHNNRGNILHQLGRLDEAEASYRRTLEIKPEYADTYCNLGSTLNDLGRPAEAEASYRRALKIKPVFTEAYSNLGITLQNLDRKDEAEVVYRRALEIMPNSAAAYLNLAITLRSLGRLVEAEGSCRHALELKPDNPEAYNNLGIILQDICRLDEAEANYRRALRIKPDNAGAHSNLLLALHYNPQLSAAEIFTEHVQWDARQTGACVRARQPANDRKPQCRLRVGYVSPDLRQHSVAYFLEPLLREHDHQKVEVFCYAEVAQPDAVTERLQRLVDHWLTTVGMTDEALARRIAHDKIDILVDLAGHTEHNRLLVFARKPAPVQVTWLGYPHSTGLRTMDYRVVDTVTDPLGEADTLASETMVRLDDGFLCYAAPAEAPPVAALPSLASDSITFGSFNNPAKLSSLTLDAWAMLMRHTPNSRLLAKGKLFADADGRAAFLAKLQQRGVDKKRVTLLAPAPSLTEHLALYEQVDIALDPFPYNGTTTTCEALWMGVPVVTLRGNRHAGRVGASLLTQIGLKELIASSIPDYVDIAVGLANDQLRLKGLRRTMRTRMAESSLCAAPAFARKMEAAYCDMWQRYCATVDQTTLTLADGVRIVVPNSLELITPYVLAEQQDWFEDEIKFLRYLLQPGQMVIDIGANYGVYALSMAKTVGSAGTVWAFEPSSSTAILLAESIAVNGFGQIILDRSALSNSCGTAQLSLNKDSELNALIRGKPSEKVSETVPLVTLDKCLEQYGWQDIEFMKIDAEGEEANILKGGERFFTELSPLVQFEIRAGEDQRMEPLGILLESFTALGYTPYRLVPGLNILAPFEAHATPDNYQLNLFCCKQDRAVRLAARGLLVSPAVNLLAIGPECCDDIVELAKRKNVYDWQQTIANFPYGIQLKNFWEQTMAAGNSAGVDVALTLYALSRDPSQSATDRYRSLAASNGILKSLCEHHPSHLRLASLARVAQDYGERSIAVNALKQLIQIIRENNQVDLSEPFLVPGRRFDSIPPGTAVGNWALASALEELEKLAYFSSFFSGASAWDRLKIIHSLGFGSAEMERRLRLLEKRFGLSPSSD